MKELGWIALAGGIGTLARFGLASAVQRIFGERFPWGTLTVNMLGCFLFGLVWMMAEQQVVFDGRTRLIVLTGFMGAFTTFSTFAFEGGIMLQNAKFAYAAAHIIGQNVIGLICIYAGLTLGRLL